MLRSRMNLTLSRSPHAGLRLMRTVPYGTPNGAYKGLKNAGLKDPELKVSPDFPVAGQRWAKHSIGGTPPVARWEKHTIGSTSKVPAGNFAETSPKRRTRLSRLRKVKSGEQRPEVIDTRFSSSNPGLSEGQEGQVQQASQEGQESLSQKAPTQAKDLPQEAKDLPQEAQVQEALPQETKDLQVPATEAKPISTEPKKKRRVLKPRKALITLTPKAITNLRALLDQPEPQLIRIGVQNRGCSGLTYQLDYVTEPGKFDEVVEQDGVKVFIDSKALFSIVGSEMDWIDDKLSQRFIFRNPNSKGTCGCGESFMV